MNRFDALTIEEMNRKYIGLRKETKAVNNYKIASNVSEDITTNIVRASNVLAFVRRDIDDSMTAINGVQSAWIYSLDLVIDALDRLSTKSNELTDFIVSEYHKECKTWIR